jgi:hypothetical protein
MQMSMGPRFLTVSEKHCSTAGSSVMSMLWVVMVVEGWSCSMDAFVSRMSC